MFKMATRIACPKEIQGTLYLYKNLEGRKILKAEKKVKIKTYHLGNCINVYIRTKEYNKVYGKPKLWKSIDCRLQTYMQPSTSKKQCRISFMITDYIIHVEYFLFNCGIICWYGFFIFFNKKVMRVLAQRPTPKHI